MGKAKAGPTWFLVDGQQWATDGYVLVRSDFVIPPDLEWRGDVEACDLGAMILRARRADAWPESPPALKQYLHVSPWTGRKFEGDAHIRPDELLPDSVLPFLRWAPQDAPLLLAEGVTIEGVALSAQLTVAVVRRASEIVALVGAKSPGALNGLTLAGLRAGETEPELPVLGSYPGLTGKRHPRGRGFVQRDAGGSSRPWLMFIPTLTGYQFTSAHRTLRDALRTGA